MFAFALWDAREGQLLLARDRLGKKPLYYHLTDKQIVFASEMKALLTQTCVSRRIDHAALDMYFSLGYVPAPYTVMAGIRKLQAGCALMVDRESHLQKRRYWDISPGADRFSSVHEACEELLAQLDQAVRMRLVADVPVGMLLSGGVDSATVAALATKHVCQLKTFSVGFSEAHLSELSAARAVADRLGTDHHEIYVESCPADLVCKLMWHMDEPSADPAIVPTFLVSQLARQSVKVVLTGEGGDEIFGGYPYHLLEQTARRIHRIPTWFRRHVLVGGAQLLNLVRGKPHYHPRTLWNWTLGPGSDVLAWTAVFTADDKHALYEARFRQSLSDDRVGRHISSVASHNTQLKSLERYLYLDTKLGLADGLLMKVDRMSMAASLEARTPLLDYPLVEFSFGLPSTYKIGAHANKYILRLAARELLPASTIAKPKQFFMVPERRWLCQELSELFWDLQRTRGIQELGVLDTTGVRRVWEQMLADVPGAARQVWAVLSFCLWYDLYVNRA
jgi:asparagine synthase (glutamine-hydrolysing)